MQSIQSKPTTHHGSRSPFIHKELKQTIHVFVRDDTVQRSLQPEYQGPYEILARINEKLYTVLIKAVQRINREVETSVPDQNGKSGRSGTSAAKRSNVTTEKLQHS